jgi:hypothetical protein
MKFTTPPLISIPTVRTGATLVTIVGLPPTFYGEILANGGASIIDHGFYWGTSQSSQPNRISLGSRSGTGLGVFSQLITSFPQNTTYYYKAYARNSAGIGYGGVLSIKTATSPKITTTSLPSGLLGSTYNQTLIATGTTPITWSITSGSLPDGLSLNQSTGLISGTPKAVGTYSFPVIARNSAGSDTKTLSITIGAYTLPVQPPTGYVGKPYSYKIPVPPGITPMTWTASGLPPGLRISMGTGEISGTPTKAGSFRITAIATGRTTSGTRTVTVNLTIVIRDAIIPYSLLEDIELQFDEEDAADSFDESMSETNEVIEVNEMSEVIEKISNNGCNAVSGYFVLALLGVSPFIRRE